MYRTRTQVGSVFESYESQMQKNQINEARTRTKCFLKIHITGNRKEKGVQPGGEYGVKSIREEVWLG